MKKSFVLFVFILVLFTLPISALAGSSPLNSNGATDSPPQPFIDKCEANGGLPFNWDQGYGCDFEEQEDVFCTFDSLCDGGWLVELNATESFSSPESATSITLDTPECENGVLVPIWDGGTLIYKCIQYPLATTKTTDNDAILELPLYKWDDSNNITQPVQGGTIFEVAVEESYPRDDIVDGEDFLNECNAEGGVATDWSEVSDYEYLVAYCNLPDGSYFTCIDEGVSGVEHGWDACTQYPPDNQLSSDDNSLITLALVKNEILSNEDYDPDDFRSDCQVAGGTPETSRFPNGDYYYECRFDEGDVIACDNFGCYPRPDSGFREILQDGEALNEPDTLQAMESDNESPDSQDADVHTAVCLLTGGKPDTKKFPDGSWNHSCKYPDGTVIWCADIIPCRVVGSTLKDITPEGEELKSPDIRQSQEADDNYDPGDFNEVCELAGGTHNGTTISSSGRRYDSCVFPNGDILWCDSSGRCGLKAPTLFEVFADDEKLNAPDSVQAQEESDDDTDDDFGEDDFNEICELSGGTLGENNIWVEEGYWAACEYPDGGSVWCYNGECLHNNGNEDDKKIESEDEDFGLSSIDPNKVLAHSQNPYILVKDPVSCQSEQTSDSDNTSEGGNSLINGMNGSFYADVVGMNGVTVATDEELRQRTVQIVSPNNVTEPNTVSIIGSNFTTRNQTLGFRLAIPLILGIGLGVLTAGLYLKRASDGMKIIELVSQQPMKLVVGAGIGLGVSALSIAVGLVALFMLMSGNSTAQNVAQGCNAVVVHTAKLDYLVTKPEKSDEEEVVENVAQKSNCRYGPGTHFNVYFTLQKGDAVKVLGRTEDAGWFFIEFVDYPYTGVRCWVWSNGLGDTAHLGDVTVVSSPPAADRNEEGGDEGESPVSDGGGDDGEGPISDPISDGGGGLSDPTGGNTCINCGGGVSDPGSSGGGGGEIIE